MRIQELVDLFKSYGDDVGLPIIPLAEWETIRSNYEKKDLKDSLAHYIHENKVPFPYQNSEEEKIKIAFNSLLKHHPSLYYPNNAKEKEVYKYSYEKYPLGVIKTYSSAFNIISDSFQWKNRYNCRSMYEPAPLEIWNNLELLLKKRWIFWGDNILGKEGITNSSYLTSFRLLSYLCSQFRPEVAKFCYEHTNAKTVLDLSCGWGDRLAGFYATANTKEYIGCDPNPEVYEIYKTQCLHYEKFLGHNAELKEFDNYFECKGSKFVRIYNLPAEDVDWNQYENYFDVMMTSPPYFDLEKYDTDSEKSDNQSWKRYPEFQNWKEEFLFPLLSKIIPTIKDTGNLMLNIVDPKSSKKGNYSICDDMVEFVDNLFPYRGMIGMEIRTRPSALVNKHQENEIKSKTIEPIFVFGNHIQTNTVEDFF